MAKLKAHFPADLDLDEMIAKPGAGRPPPPFHETPVAPQPPVPAAKHEPLKGKAIATTFYLLPDDHRRLRRLAVDRDVAAQTLLLDALDMLFREAGEAPVERWQPRRKVRP